MNSGSSDMLLLDFINRHGLITVDAACVLLGLQPNAVIKRLSKLKLRKARYIHPTCYWYATHPLGAQALPTRAGVLCHCVFSEPRWELEGWDGPAAICSSDDRTEAVFPDLNASPTHIVSKLRRYCGKGARNITGLALLLPTESKAAIVGRALAGNNLPLPVRLVVIEDLYYLLARPSCPGNRSTHR